MDWRRYQVISASGICEMTQINWESGTNLHQLQKWLNRRNVTFVCMPVYNYGVM